MDKLHRINGVLWDKYATPLCPKHRMEMNAWNKEADSDTYDLLKCEECDGFYEIPRDIDDQKVYVRRKLKSKELQSLTVVSLDDEAIPLAEFKVKSKDDKFFATAIITESKVGKRLVVYAGEKGRSGKTQIFVEPEIKRLAFDQRDLHPNDVFIKLEAEFDDGTKSTLAKKKEKISVNKYMNFIKRIFSDEINWRIIQAILVVIGIVVAGFLAYNQNNINKNILGLSFDTRIYFEFDYNSKIGNFRNYGASPVHIETIRLTSASSTINLPIQKEFFPNQQLTRNFKNDLEFIRDLREGVNAVQYELLFITNTPDGKKYNTGWLLVTMIVKDNKVESITPSNSLRINKYYGNTLDFYGIK